MRYQFVIYEKKGHIAYVTINRPEVMNALHYDTNAELSEAFDDFKQDDESWVAILTGAGNRAFSAGNDLKATAAAIAKGDYERFRVRQTHHCGGEWRRRRWGLRDGTGMRPGHRG